MKILLIAGHGEGDPGAVANGYFEAALTREVVALLTPLLEKFALVDVYDTSKNMYRHLSDGEAFDFKAYDYVFEVHFNAAAKDAAGNGVTTGSEIYVHPGEAKISAEENILKNISALGFKNRGVKRRSNLLNMNICKGRQGVSYALVEVCFIDDKDDIILYQKKKTEIAKAIADGIAEGFGIELNTNNKEEVIMSDAEFKKKYENLVENDYGAKEPQAWSQEARAWAEENKIVQGDEKGWMHYQSPITREEAVQMLYNFYKIIK